MKFILNVSFSKNKLDRSLFAHLVHFISQREIRLRVFCCLLSFLGGVNLIFTSGCRLDDNRIRGSYGHSPNNDSEPDPFSFTDQSDIALSTLTLSNIVEILGTNKPSDVSVSGEGNPEYRICSDSSCTTEILSWGNLPGTKLIRTNDYVQLRLTSSASNSLISQAQLNVGGVVAAWQVTTLDAPIAPSLLSATWKQLTTGRDFTCGLTSDGKAYCWGADGDGQLGENADGDNFDEYTPVLIDTSSLTPGTSLTSISAGAYHTCGLASDGKAYCWGSDTYGQLGENADGDNLDENIPVLVDTSALTPGSSFLSISTGTEHSCGLSSDGKAYCWGYDVFGQLGENADGDNLNENIPVLVDTSALTSGSSFISLSPGNNHTCGLASDGKAYCWGQDSYGQLGENADGDNLNENIPVLVDTSALTSGTSFISISAGYYHTCGLASDGKAYCWGYDNNGELGENADGDNLNENIPVLVDISALAPGASFVSISSGDFHTCGLSSDGNGYCWGLDTHGQLGENADGDNLNEDIPVPIESSAFSSGSRLISIESGSYQTCGVSNEGKAYCWGRDLNGQLGENADGDNFNEDIPVEVDSSALNNNPHFISLAMGRDHSCGLTSNGKAFCWGSDAYGQLGEDADGDNLNENIPVLVDTSALSAGTRFISITAGSFHSCGLSSDGKAYCWGQDDDGQLGENADGDNLNENIPILVDTSALSPGASFVSLSAGGSRTCGLSSDGKAYCWGSDSSGQLGENADGDNLDEVIPVLVDTSALSPGASFVSLIAAGNTHTFGLSSDGKAYSWGSDGNGRLGENADGDNLNENIPVLVDISALDPGDSFVTINAGNGHACGLTSSGKAYCWGWDNHGQLGENADGNNLDENIPTIVDTLNLNSGTRFTLITCGYFHTCGLANDGIAYCWGQDSQGQLGENEDGDNLDENIPVPVDRTRLSAGASFISLVAGGYHTCGLSSDGSTYCWGNDGNEQLGTAVNQNENIPTPVDTTNLTP